MNVFIQLGADLGANLGPTFSLTANYGLVTPSTVSLADITGDGVTVSINSELATQISITSTGVCNSVLTLTISGTPTTTTTTLPPTTTTTTAGGTTTTTTPPTTTTTTGGTTTTTIPPTTTTTTGNTTTTTTEAPAYYNYWTNRYSCDLGCGVSPDEIHIYTLEALVEGNIYFSDGYVYIISTETGVGGTAVLGVIDGPYESCEAALVGHCAEPSTTTTTTTTIAVDFDNVTYSPTSTNNVCNGFGDAVTSLVYWASGIFGQGTVLYEDSLLESPWMNNGSIYIRSSLSPVHNIASDSNVVGSVNTSCP